MNQAKLQIGMVLKGRYKILSELGEGGFASIFLAQDQDLARQVAIKQLKSDPLGKDSDLLRFQREAKLLAQLKHKNIVSVYSFDLDDESSVPFIVMEYLQGTSLQRYLLEHGRLTQQQCKAVLTQVCDGLSFAHKLGIVHRDLSPANIFLSGNSNDWTVKIIDFGLSKLFEDTQGKLTQTGALMGNPAYMSPEMVRGERIDHLCDIYAIGCILYECMGAVPAFKADNPIALIMQQQNNFPPEPEFNWGDKQVELKYKNIALRCLQKTPSNRLQTADAIVLCLEENKPAQMAPPSESIAKLQQWSSSANSQEGKPISTANKAVIAAALAVMAMSSIFFIAPRTFFFAIKSLHSPLLVGTEETFAQLEAVSNPALAADIYLDLLSHEAIQKDAAASVNLEFKLAQSYLSSGKQNLAISTLSSTLNDVKRLDTTQQKQKAATQTIIMLDKICLNQMPSQGELALRADILNMACLGRQKLLAISTLENFIPRAEIWAKQHGNSPTLNRCLDSLTLVFRTFTLQPNARQTSILNSLEGYATKDSISKRIDFINARKNNAGTPLDDKILLETFYLDAVCEQNPTRGIALSESYVKSHEELAEPIKLDILSQAADSARFSGDLKKAMQLLTEMERRIKNNTVGDRDRFYFYRQKAMICFALGDRNGLRSASLDAMDQILPKDEVSIMDQPLINLVQGKRVDVINRKLIAPGQISNDSLHMFDFMISVLINTKQCDLQADEPEWLLREFVVFAERV
ncbi:MAG: serine/threonine protein kinase, partial [Candidatus Obscuribacterales bacterium]|nr:serine/threonine protein kinase [Candidatus Obscuribacterales bacterium]